MDLAWFYSIPLRHPAFTTYDNPMVEKANVAQAVHEQGRILMDYMQPMVGGVQLAICKPTIAAKNFKIKSRTLQMVKSS